MIVLLETLVTTCIMNVLCMIIIFLFGFVIYTEACLLDIRSLFDQVSRMSKQKTMDTSKRKKSKSQFNEYCKNSEILMLERCKEAFELHGRLNRSVFLPSCSFDALY